MGSASAWYITELGIAVLEDLVAAGDETSGLAPEP
jgi:hypothetical protein